MGIPWERGTGLPGQHCGAASLLPLKRSHLPFPSNFPALASSQQRPPAPVRAFRCPAGGMSPGKEAEVLH